MQNSTIHVWMFKPVLYVVPVRSIFKYKFSWRSLDRFVLPQGWILWWKMNQVLIKYSNKRFRAIDCKNIWEKMIFIQFDCQCEHPDMSLLITLQSSPVGGQDAAQHVSAETRVANQRNCYYATPAWWRSSVSTDEYSLDSCRDISPPNVFTKSLFMNTSSSCLAVLISLMTPSTLCVETLSKSLSSLVLVKQRELDKRSRVRVTSSCPGRFGPHSSLYISPAAQSPVVPASSQAMTQLFAAQCISCCHQRGCLQTTAGTTFTVNLTWKSHVSCLSMAYAHRGIYGCAVTLSINICFLCLLVND